MFEQRFKVMSFVECLREYAGIKESHPVDPTVGNGMGIEEIPMGHEAIGKDHILALLYQELFEAPHTFVNHHPLEPEGQELWRKLVNASRRKGANAYGRAAEMAEWLESQYDDKSALQFEDASYSVLLNGHPYKCLPPEGYALLQVLASRIGSPDSNASTSEIIACFRSGGPAFSDERVFAQFSDFPENESGRKRISRAIDSLPTDLQELIEGRPRRGRRLRVQTYRIYPDRHGRGQRKR